ncbi:tail Collar domain-containing protein [Dyadobacter beijingensis]|uniref:Tail Collar domain-containing protein n=1 Tax=Dyadobacter beijingensis TaxID=365489 RepID=A0ABQ2HY05_9BACT|nr:tail fiber protein [Dyadobacter beijingensis]GGM94069.1 tail Collar domain-containing protein [Dyadobacter beijingensis]
MATPYVGEIRLFAGTFAPAGWMLCQGQTLPISENEVLFQLIGTTYGGDGQETFRLPDMQGRLPVHMGSLSGGSTYQIGESGGSEEVTLTLQQIPNHNHAFLAATTGADVASPRDAVLGISTTTNGYIASIPSQPMAADIAPFGGSQPHTNVQPFLCVNFIISLFGVFPSQG